MIGTGASERARGPRLALVLALLTAACGISASEAGEGEIREEFGLSPEARVHRVDLAVAGDRLRMLPLRTRIRTGDAVQLVVLDNLTHLVRFLTDETDQEVLAFLTRTDQLRPPPLVEREARLVLSFQGAPPGRYPFRVEAGGFEATGEIVVE
jgi:hypothetical protein